MIQTTKLTHAAAKLLARRCLAELVAETEERGGYVAGSDRPDMEVLEQLGLSEERVGQLNGQLLACNFDLEVVDRAKQAAHSHALELDTVPAARRIDLLSGVARALLERERLYQQRLTDRLSTFRPVDPLFDGEVTGAPAVAVVVNGGSSGLAISQAISRYLAAPEHQWVLKTRQAKVWQLAFFAQHVGPDLAVVGCTVDHVRSYRDAVRTLHRRHDRIGGSFKNRQTPNIDHRISDKTAQTIFDTAKTFLRWCRATEGLISINPADDIRLVAQPQPKGQKPRRPLEEDEQRTIFAAPIFTGCHSMHRRYAAGRLIKRWFGESAQGG